MKYKRPHIPYEGKAMPNNTRYQILTQNHQPPTAEMLDGEMNYCIDSMNDLDQAIQEVVAGNIDGSDNPDNRNKVLKTDGAGNLSWVFAGEDQLAEQGVTATKIRDAAVKTAKIDNLQVTTEKINDSAIVTAKILDANITETKLANNAVTTAKIADGNVTTTKVANQAIVTDKIADNAVTTAKMTDANVTTAKVANAAITYNKIGNDVVLNVMKLIFPVGAVYITFANQNPPFHGAGITWEALPEGHAVMTANGGNTGSRSGGNRLDTGSTAGHVLTIDQMPQHHHNEFYKRWRPGSQETREHYVQATAAGNYVDAATSSTGNNQPHSHNLNIYNQKLLFWRRTA